MNRRKTKAKWRRRPPHWSKRRLDNHYEEFRQRQRANWSELVPEITFVLLKCRATRERAHIGGIASEAVATYPGMFETYSNGRKIPDYSLILLALAEAKKREWGYAAGDWFKGWRLTKKGAAFARDVQRRRDLKLTGQAAIYKAGHRSANADAFAVALMNNSKAVMSDRRSGIQAAWEKEIQIQRR